MERSLLLPLFLIEAVCLFHFAQGMEKDYRILTPSSLPSSPTSQALLGDAAAYIATHTESTMFRSVKKLIELCVIKIINHNIVKNKIDFSPLPLELQQLIKSDAEFALKNPTLYSPFPSFSPTHPRKLKRPSENGTPLAKRRLFIG